MKKFCVLAPSKGTELFNKLKKLLGYDLAWDIYETVIHQDFLEDYKDTLTLDSEGIPTFESIMANPYIQKKIGLGKVKVALQDVYKSRENTHDNMLIAISEAQQFNLSNPNNKDFVAIIQERKGLIRTTLVPRNVENLNKFKDLFGTFTLNERIKEILTPLGITIGLITGAERNNNITGVVDFSKAKSLAEDLIRVAEGLEGEQVLSEEFAHLCVEVFKDNPLIKRAKNIINDEKVLKEILGESYNWYLDTYQSLDKLIEEALGRLLQQGFYNDLEVPVKAKSLFSRIVNYIKNFFKKISTDKLRTSIYEALSAMNSVATDILSGNLELTKLNIKGIERTDELYNLLDLIAKNIKILSTATDMETKMAKIKNNTAATPFIELMISFQLNDADTALGISLYLQHAILELNSLNSQFQLIHSPNTKTKFGYLRKIHDYIHMYAGTLLELNRALAEATDDDEMLILTRTFNIDGVNAATIRDLVNKCFILSEELIGKYQAESIDSITQFFKPFLGENVTNPFKSGERTISVEELIKEAKSDISWMDKWLTSMAESSDAMLLLFDAAAKKAKDKARLETIEISKLIQSAYLKALSKGVTDFTFMYRKISGVKTSFYIATGPELELLNEAELEFYNTFMALKHRLDLYVDDSRATAHHVILLRKDFNYGAVGLIALGKFDLVGEYFKNKVFESVSDEGEGYARSALIGFDGKEYMLVPKYYLNDLDNQEDVSEDPVGSLIAYAYMATNYKQMDDIVDALETGRDILKQRKVKETRGSLIVKELFNWSGITVASEVNKDWESTNIALKLNHFFESQIYGRYLKDEGVFDTPFGRVNALKLTSTILGLAAHLQLGCNWLANTANVANGIAMTNIEVACSKYFTPASLAKADKEYASLLGEYILELHNPIKKSKLALIEEYFDTRLQFPERAKIKYDKSFLTSIFGPNLAFIGQEAGDHWLYNRIAIAMLLSTKATYVDANGNTVETSVYDALDVVTDENGVARLLIKSGYNIPNLKGNVFTTMSRKIGNVNLKLFGIYNQDDQVAAQRVAIGRLALMYRKWMVPALNKRFQRALYNTTMDLWEEGYYLTAYLYLIEDTIADLKRGQFQLIARWNTLSDDLKKNITRALTEVGLYMAVLGAIFVLGLLYKDDKNRPWAIKFLDYQLKRQKTELGVLIPGFNMLKEGKKIIDSPAAGLSAVDNILTLTLALINPYSYIDKRESGLYKGMTTLEKAIYINTPYVKNIHRATDDIQYALQYFNN